MTTIWLLFLALWAPPQHQVHAPAGEKPFALMPGLGRLHHPIATRSADAQRYFDQGLTLVYAFNHAEARRSFERAAQLDPQLAMAWWGIALAVGPNYNETDVDAERTKAASEAIQKARSLTATGARSRRERP